MCEKVALVEQKSTSQKQSFASFTKDKIPTITNVKEVKKISKKEHTFKVKK